MFSHYLESASSYARDIDGLLLLIVLIVGFWFFVAQGVLFFLIFKYRKKEGVPAKYITGEKKSEKRWVTIPHMMVLACDVVIIVATLMVWMKVKQKLPEADETIRIISQQWAWTFQHPGADGELDTKDDIQVLDELHVRKDTIYQFELLSKDVIHSLSVPVFRLKQDAVPGRIIRGWFQPTRIGEYDIQCAEICGVGHSLMMARLFVETPREHENWMAIAQKE